MTQQGRKILVLFAHPGQRYSRANAELAQVARRTPGVTFVDLYAEYPRFKINVELEQQRLLDHDVIVFQFPLFWYSTPALLKEWQDLVLEYGFAYGEGGVMIAGKLFVPVVTTGGPEDFYRVGARNNFPLRDLLAPIEQTANLCGLRFVPPYTLYAALRAAGSERLATHVEGYGRFLQALRDDRLDLDAADGLPVLTADTLPIIEEAQS
ncbi:NAD(P)H-dependent oxidoreductase [Hoeflea poritis]|uniref:NAD(P)H-dependent oxidoreductase n=1 Tax=Hoeflea poritis TaxID=2993659 RepID=A0ABT4VQ34_9HYPH|nr:NAD(P)H-dependent oxidoreductase [Hoeflea poritis]MDA4846128.1 NAD(P)H-dependent oxidoreductase [Hoeflea poritis]